MAIVYYEVNTAQQTFQTVPSGTWIHSPWTVTIDAAITWVDDGNKSRSLLNISGDVDEWYGGFGRFWYKDGDTEGDAILVSQSPSGSVIAFISGVSGVTLADDETWKESPYDAGEYFESGIAAGVAITPIKFGYSFSPSSFEFASGYPSGYGAAVDFVPTVETVTKTSPTDSEVVESGDTVLLEWTYDGTGCSKFSVDISYVHPINGVVNTSTEVDQPTKELDVSALVVQLEAAEVEQFTWSVRGYDDENEVYVADPDPSWVVDVLNAWPTLVSPANGAENQGLNTDWLKEMVWDDTQAEPISAYTVYFSKSSDTALPQDDRSRYSILDYKMSLGVTLEYGTEYHWFVRRVVGESTKDSQTWTFTTFPIYPPSPSRNAGNGKVNGLNNMTTIRRLVAASQNMIWYET